jgi:hypothetical protein
MAWASELLRLIRPSDVSRTRFSSSSNGRARSWRTASRRSGGWPRIAFSIANSSAMRSSASLAIGEAVA